MGLIKTGLNKIREKRNDLAAAGLPYGHLHMGLLIISGTWKWLIAKWYLRRCTSIGRLVTVKGKPQIIANGEIHLGDEVRIWSIFNKTKIFVQKGAVLTVGRNTRLNGVHLSVSSRIEIHDNVRIAPYCIIIDSDFHKLEDHFSNEGIKKPIVIEDDVWITMNCMILKGVRIGKGSVVAAGSVVTKDVQPYTAVGGVPAKIIKKIR